MLENKAAQEDATRDERVRLRLGLETVLGVPFTAGNAIEAFRNGDEIFPPMLEAIAAAKHRIEFLTFVYWTGNVAEQFVEALAERARAGVEVMVMLDGYGALPMPRKLIRRMQSEGVQVRWFRPLPRWRAWQTDNRTHRKILVCDGRVGFTGGVGIAREWEGAGDRPENWRDTHFRIRGPAVLALRGAFYEDWLEREHTIAPALQQVHDPGQPGAIDVQTVPATASVGRSAIAALHDALILLARRRLRVATAYFSPTPEETESMLGAVRRGVEVEVLLPGPYTDKRVSELAGSDAIDTLIDAGVRFWRFQPTMFHTKLLTVDGRLACIGSANFNHRSVIKDDELALNVLDDRFTALMDQHFDDDLARSEPMRPGDWHDRSLFRRALEAASNRISPET